MLQIPHQELAQNENNVFQIHINQTTLKSIQILQTKHNT